MEYKDKYFTSLTEGDIFMLQKSFGIIMITPFLTFFFMYGAKEVK